MATAHISVISNPAVSFRVEGCWSLICSSGITIRKQMVLLPTQVFYSAAIKSRFRPLSCTGIPGCRSTAVCPAVVPLVTLAGESSRAGLWNLTHLPVWSARWQRSLDNSPSCLRVNHSGPGRCPQTWLRQ